MLGLVYLRSEINIQRQRECLWECGRYILIHIYSLPVLYDRVKLAFIPLGGSFVILIPFCSIEIGKAIEG